MSSLRRLQTTLASTLAGSETFDVSSRLYQGRSRCGDVADVIHLDERRCCVLIVDGGGHGVPGITQAQMIRSAVRAAVGVSDDVISDASPLFEAMNRMMAGLKSRQVIPCLLMAIDMASGKLCYINAGCPPPLLLVRAGRMITLDQPSLVLGVDPDYVYETSRVDLPESFRLVCHTDGLVYANNAGGEPLGDARLHDALLDKEAFGSVDDVLGKIAHLWSTHLVSAQPDDDALVVVIGRG